MDTVFADKLLNPFAFPIQVMGLLDSVQFSIYSKKRKKKKKKKKAGALPTIIFITRCFWSQVELIFFFFLVSNVNKGAVFCV